LIPDLAFDGLRVGLPIYIVEPSSVRQRTKRLGAALRVEDILARVVRYLSGAR
jgi:hypothetical protein